MMQCTLTLYYIGTEEITFVTINVKRFVLCYRSIVCLSCLSVPLVYCGQTVGWIKMKLSVQVGLGPSHIVLDGDPPPPIFDPCLLWPNGWLDQDATCYRGRPRPRRHCVRWGLSSPKRGTTPNFWPMSTVAKWSPISATAEHLFLNATITVIIRQLDVASCYRWSVCYDHEPCNSGWTDCDAIWGVDSGGPKEPQNVLDGGPDSHTWRGSFEGKKGLAQEMSGSRCTQSNSTEGRTSMVLMLIGLY